VVAFLDSKSSMLVLFLDITESANPSFFQVIIGLGIPELIHDNWTVPPSATSASVGPDSKIGGTKGK